MQDPSRSMTMNIRGRGRSLCGSAAELLLENDIKYIYRSDGKVSHSLQLSQHDAYSLGDPTHGSQWGVNSLDAGVAWHIVQP